VDKDNDRAVRCTDRGSTRAQGDRRFDRGCVLTVFLSFLSWRSVRRAEQDGYWVSHTHEVMAMIQGTSRDVLENGNQRAGIRPERARAFAGALSDGPLHHLAGHEPAAGFRPRGEVK